jgi:tRNA modification GTPase
MWSADELIVAPATVAGCGGRAVVRLAGDGLDGLLSRLFRPAAAGFARPGERPRVVAARLADDLAREWGAVDVDVLHWPGPAGPIGGPLAEAQLPCSGPLIDAVVAEACRHGARLARGGEFTLRGFLAGRLDLLQAEAVLAVVDARTPEELTAALDRLAGGAGRQLDSVRGILLDLLADIEAAIDFADETTPDAVPAGPAWSTTAGRLDECDAALAAVAAGLARRDASAAGLPRVVLAGRPNIGKSSLFNALAGGTPALVADEPGTTRDWLEARLHGPEGPRCVLVDLAGISPAGAVDEVTAAAEALARGEIGRADVIVSCRDAATAGRTVRVAGVPCIDVLTRCDLVPAAAATGEFATSSRTGAGLEAVRAAILAAVANLPPRTPAGLRLAVGVDAARAALGEGLAVVRAPRRNAAVDEALVACLVRRAVEALAEVTGAAIGTDLLDRIFSRHCIGK